MTTTTSSVVSATSEGGWVGATARSLLWDGILTVKGGVPTKRRQLERWQRLDAPSSEELQRTRLEELVRHAHRNVPHYRSVLESSGVVDNGEIHLDQFRQIRLLDKATLRTRGDELMSEDCGDRDWYFNTSGGSTGEPVRFVQDRIQWAWQQAVKQLLDRWTGYRTGMPRVRLWGSERDILQGREKLTTRIARWLRNDRFLNAFRMGEDDMRRFVDVIDDVQPVQILAYAEAIFELARFVRRSEIDVHSPDAIMSSAGTLHDHMRSEIEKAFSAPVFDRYGSREVGDMACECEAHEGLHVVEPTHLVEILDDDGQPTGPGELGEVVVTPLTAYAMPLLRYRIGDMAIWKEEACACGRPWRMIEKVVGRVSDVFVNAGGDRIHGEYFTHLMYGRDWVRKFQFRQDRKDRVTLEVELRSKPYDIDAELAEIGRAVREVMGAECNFVSEIVETIEPTESGKYRYVVSKVRE